ncbi:unnamed protein product [Brassica napus]|uniref:(rape) hypothetical protein n=1 Tax=Brassica napus TaxID=3708 RepID=A0A816XLI3_BRANA|nr:unnamed protein product [Brassica napus]
MEVPINVNFMGQREVMDLFVLCDARFPKFQLANGINIQSQSVTLRFDERFDERIWDPGEKEYGKCREEPLKDEMGRDIVIPKLFTQ